MSNDVRVYEATSGDRVKVTAFWGGTERKESVQFTLFTPTYVQLGWIQVRRLATRFARWLDDDPATLPYTHGDDHARLRVLFYRGEDPHYTMTINGYDLAFTRPQGQDLHGVLIDRLEGALDVDQDDPPVLVRPDGSTSPVEELRMWKDVSPEGATDG